MATAGNIDKLRRLLIAITNDVKTNDNNLTNFVGILYELLVLKEFRIKFTLLEVTCLAEASTTKPIGLTVYLA